MCARILTHRATGARPRNEANLRHHSGGLDVRMEDIRVSGKRIDALLNARTAAIVDANNGHPKFGRFLHDFDDLLRVCLGK